MLSKNSTPDTPVGLKVHRQCPVRCRPLEGILLALVVNGIARAQPERTVAGAALQSRLGRMPKSVKLGTLYATLEVFASG